MSIKKSGLKNIGWEIHIIRQSIQHRGGRTRTIGTYQVYHDGAAQPLLKGSSVETKGKGDNAVKGNGRRVESNRYPLATQSGSHYVTIGYLVSNDSDQTPKPALELGETGNRTEILIHPGHGFLASIGCINLTSFLNSGDEDIDFVDSRDRVIFAINDLKNYCGAKFPHYNGQPITNAWAVIDGEP